MDDLDNLDELCDQIKAASLCGLGQTAPNPVVTTLKYFRDEYVAHIREKKCPAHVCAPLLTYTINDKCTGCVVCAKACPTNAITGERKQMHFITPGSLHQVRQMLHRLSLRRGGKGVR